MAARTVEEHVRALGWRHGAVKPSIEEKGAAVRWATAVTIGFATLLCAPAMLAGTFADDILHELIFREFPEAFARTLNIFSFMKSPAEVALFRNWGVLPWWASNDVRIDFFRPIPSLIHAVDFALFSYAPVAVHVMSIAWYVASTWLVSRVLARFFPENSRLILVAVAIFALNGSHAVNVQWAANRNDLIASVFMLGAFLGWLRWRETRRARELVLLFGAYLAALLSKESGVLLPVMIATHALVFPSPGTKSGPLWRRLRPWRRELLALGLITAGYLAAYFLSGHGADSMVYINPAHHPVRWLEAAPRAFTFHLATLATGVHMLMLGQAPLTDAPIPSLVAIGATLGFVVLAFVLLRRERAVQFFAVWVGLFLLQLTTTFPDARLVYMASVGFAFIVTRVLAVLWERRAALAPRLAFGVLVLLHFIVAPIVMQVTFHIMRGFDTSYEALRSDLRASIDYDRLPDSGTEVFFLNWNQRETSALAGLWLSQVEPTGIDVHAQLSSDRGEYVAKIDRAFSKMKIHYTPLSFLLGEVDLRVVDDRTITLSPAGSTFFPTIFEQLYMTDNEFTVGQSVELPNFTATIEELSRDPSVRRGTDVTRVRFVFKEPIDSARYRFMAWEAGHLRPVRLQPGSSMRLAQR